MSVDPPGGNGTSSVTGLDGQAWACTAVAAIRPNAIEAMGISSFFMDEVSLRCLTGMGMR